MSLIAARTISIALALQQPLHGQYVNLGII